MAKSERRAVDELPPEGLSKEEALAWAEKVQDALAKAREGDPSKINPFYDRNAALVQFIGDQMLRAEKDILKYWGEAGKGPEMYLESMRDELGYATAGGLQRLLIDRVVVCWLRVQQAEHIRTSKDKEGVGIQSSRYFDRRLEMAHKSFLSACKTLAQVRKLLKPAVTQVNIGGQQVNVANIEAGAAEERSSGSIPAALTD